MAEKAAGIRLVIAENFERIYRQNADNVGLFTSTDFGLIERIRRGEEIDVEELVGDRDGIAATVLRSGGLLRYGRERLGIASATQTMSDKKDPRTLFEKILARHVVKTADSPDNLTPGTGGFVRADIRFIHDIYTGMCSYMLHDTFGKPVRLHEPESIIVFEDHYSYAHRSRVHIERVCFPRSMNFPGRTGNSWPTMACGHMAICQMEKGRRASLTLSWLSSMPCLGN